jgi:hypothetical protein
MWREWSRRVGYMCDLFQVEEHGYTGPGEEKGIRALVRAPDSHVVVPYCKETQRVFLQYRRLYPFQNLLLMAPSDIGMDRSQIRRFEEWASLLRKYAQKNLMLTPQLTAPHLTDMKVYIEFVISPRQEELKELTSIELSSVPNLVNHGKIADTLTAFTLFFLINLNDEHLPEYMDAME